MAYGYFKVNKEVINFSWKDEIHKILFNHYILKKVNFQKLKGDLGYNQFKISLKTASEDLTLSKTTVCRLLKEFEALGIINNVKKGSSSNSYSVYQYLVEPLSVAMQKNETVEGNDNDTADDMVESSDCKVLKESDAIVDGTVNETVHENSKIEYLNKDNIYSRVVLYLNKKSGKRFRDTTKKTRSCIAARLKDGFLEEEIYKVIDIKCEQWIGTDMERFIRPETILGSKFEGYLNERGDDKRDKSKGIVDTNFGQGYEVDFRF